MKNQIQDCTHKVPTNPYGIFAMHCIDNQPLNDADLKRVLAGPVAGAEEKLKAELAKPLDLAAQNGN
jgi:hypothetical protein